jgi:hypothetical protein
LQHIGRLRHLQSDGYKGDAYDVAVARENEVIAKLTAERDALQAKQKARNAAAAPLRLLRDNLSRYVENRLAGFEVIEAPLMPPPSLKKGETVGDAVERVRQEIGRLHDDVAAARAAPWPSSAAKAKVRQQISALVERGRPNLLVLLEGHRREFQFATRLAPPVLVRGFQESGAGVTEAGEQFDSEATLAWLFEEALIQKLDKEIERVSDDASALSDERRAAKIAELAAKTLAAERLEEALIMQGEAMGQPIQRHAAADARAVLSLSDSMPPPQRAA